jgi:hypothetical protein
MLGVHRPYIAPERTRALSPSVAEDLETKAMANAESYLRNLRVPASILETMFSNASDEIHWLSETELQTLGQRAAWYQEYLLARCGLSGDKEQAGLSAKEGSDAAKFVQTAYQCEARATYHDAANNLNNALSNYGVRVDVPTE